MIDDTFTVRPGNKDFVFVRIDNGRIFKISNRSIMNNRSIPKAVEISASYFAEFYTRFGVKPSVKYRALMIRRFRREEAV
jgi:hypothetical protein